MRVAARGPTSPALRCIARSRCGAWQPRRTSGGVASDDVWPDGTPKKFKGREAWKNWIDWDSPYRQQTDELNRQRHYFFHVDARGRLWRKELDRLDSHDGQMRDPRMLDFFFGHMQRNRTGLHATLFPYMSFRIHEHYFTSCTDAPVVFNDLRDGELRFLCPEGELARSVTTRFDPRSLRLTAEGKLFHPVATKAVDAPGAPPRRESLMALIESSTAQQLLERCDERESDGGEAELVLTWDGAEVVVREWDPASEADEPTSAGV
jgi:hypothetical protein